MTRLSIKKSPGKSSVCFTHVSSHLSVSYISSSKKFITSIQVLYLSRTARFSLINNLSKSLEEEEEEESHRLAFPLSLLLYFPHFFSLLYFSRLFYSKSADISSGISMNCFCPHFLYCIYDCSRHTFIYISSCIIMHSACERHISLRVLEASA